MQIGGQAVLEGVMMRSPHAYTVAVRKGGKPEADIAIHRETIRPIGDRYPILKKKIIRGSAALFEALWLGMHALSFSANEAAETVDGKKEVITPFAMAMTMIVAVVFALGLFVALPLLLTNVIGMTYAPVSRSSILFNLSDGAIRVVLFLGYVSGVSLLNDIRRVFEYHGAEHKAIAAHEAGVELTVENAKPFSRIHPRCGTSFLLTVVVISIVLFSLIPGSWPLWAKAASRLVLLPVIAGLGYEFIKYSAKKRGPVIAGLGYEFIKYSAKKRGHPLMAGLMAPGLWLQRLTTREPSDDQIEVALAAMREALAMEPR